MASAAAIAPKASISSDTSRRIEFLRLALIVGIVFLHIPPTWSIGHMPPEATSFAGYIKLLAAYGPFRGANPMLSLISGYLLFRRPSPFPLLMSKKAHTLLVPFLIWNVAVALMRLGYGTADIDELAPGANPIQRLLALFDRPPDYPTYFLLHLFLCAVYSPAVAWLLRRAAWPTVIVALGIGLLGHSPLPLVRADISTAFIIGGALALRDVDVTAIDSFWRPILVTYLAICLAYIVALPMLPAESPTLDLVQRLAGVPAAWTLSAVLIKTSLERYISPYSKHSFLLFCAHVPALYLLYSAWPNRVEGYWVFFAAAGPLVIVAALVGGIVLARLSPTLAGLLSGTRIAGGSPSGA